MGVSMAKSWRDYEYDEPLPDNDDDILGDGDDEMHRDEQLGDIEDEDEEIAGWLVSRDGLRDILEG